LVPDSVCSLQSHHSGLSENVSFQNRDFKMIVAVKATSSSQAQNLPPLTVHLIAPTIQEKAAWVSDITQVIITGDGYLCHLRMQIPNNMETYCRV
jgi:hypothetical protein